MRKTVKKLFCAFLSAALVCQLCTGCSRRDEIRAQEAVEQFCAALQAMDFDAMTPLLSDDDVELVQELSKVTDSLSNLIDALAEQFPAVDFLRLCAQNIHFEITSHSSVKNNMMDVTVKFSYPDLYAMFKEYMQEHGFNALANFINNLAALISGRPAESNGLQLAAPGILDWSNTKLRNGQFPSVDIEITFQCTKRRRAWSIFDAPRDSLKKMMLFGFNLT